MKQRVYYSFPVYASFVRNDETLLKANFNVCSYHFIQHKWTLPFRFIHQFFHILTRFNKIDLYVSFFAGYSSVLPAVFAKVTGRPHLIILGGTDCSSFPSIGYGNFSRFFLGKATCFSLRTATHLAPVAATLVDAENTYYDKDYSRQGYVNFCPASADKATTIHIGYDPEKFKPGGVKTANSFLTLAQMSKPNFFRKGIDLIFEAAKRFPDCRFTIVGMVDGVPLPEIPENITILPFIPYEKIAALYTSHQFYLQLSIMEGFPSAPCEAMLCGCVPITSNVGALPVIVGDTGYILEKRDIHLLQAILQRAITEYNSEKATAAREHISNAFPVNTRQQLIDLCARLLRQN